MGNVSDEQLFQLREEMVQNQIESRGINAQPITTAMRKVPRHLFVREDQREEAYEDKPLPIGPGSTISQPYIIAYMIDALHLTPHDRVLEIGTGSGYQTALLGELVDTVYSVDIEQQLLSAAQQRLTDFGYRNMFLRCGDGYKGWSSKAPFEAIIVSAACRDIPKALVEQLAEGGRMIFPLEGDEQYLILLERHNHEIVTQELCPVRFVPLRPADVDESH